MPLIAMTREMGSFGKDVAARLSEDPRCAKLNITVDGRVTLAGVLEPALDEEDALEVASQVPGVTGIKSALRSATLPKYKVDSA